MNIRRRTPFFAYIHLYTEIKDRLKFIRSLFLHRTPKEKEILPRRASLRIRRMDPEGNQLPDLPEVKPMFYQEELHVCLLI